METAFPLAALEGEEDLTAAVQVAVPLRVLGILEVGPHIVVELLEPLETLLVACELVALDHADRRLEMHPPELLVPLELLHRGTLDVLEVEDSAIFLVPSEVDHAEGDLDAFVDESLVITTDSKVHHEPEGFKVMAGIDLTAFKTVDRGSVRRDILQHHAEFRMIEHIQDLAEALVDGLVEKGLVREDVLHLKSHVADDHRKSEALHRTGSRI